MMRSGTTQEIVIGRFPPRPVIGLIDVNTGQTYEFDSFKIANHIKRLLTVGRAKNCDIKLTDPTVSLVHCDIIRNEDGTCIIQDAESMNGVIVNDVKVERTTLRPGMWVFLGRTELIAMDAEGTVRITAGGITSLTAQAARYYGSDRKAGAKLNRSHTTVGRARRRWARRRRDRKNGDEP